MTRTLKLVGMTALLTMTMGGCASLNPVVQLEPAPVSFKLGQGGYQSASLRGSKPMSLSSRSSSPVLSPTAPAKPVARPVAITPPKTSLVAPAPVAPPAAPVEDGVESLEFDTSSVDRELYAHMRIGKRYKVFGKSYTPKHQPKYDKTGTASWYGPKFHGKLTASGEAFDMNGLSAAHKTLPLNSLVHVENVETGASIILRINDRGPFSGDRIIDLSKGAAKRLDMLSSGLKEVRVRYAGPADPNSFGKKVREPQQVAEAPAPVPAPVTQPEPEVSVPSLDGYTPLRSLGGSIAEAQPAQPSLPNMSAPVPAPTMTPDFAPSYTPLDPVQAEPEDGPLTLTIKGPIHMARSSSMPGARNVVAASTRH